MASGGEQVWSSAVLTFSPATTFSANKVRSPGIKIGRLRRNNGDVDEKVEPEYYVESSVGIAFISG